MKTTLLSEAYFSGMEDAISLVERGVFAGLTIKDSLETLKDSVRRTRAGILSEAQK